MRSKNAFANIIVSLIYQLVLIVCGLLVPRLIIRTFGSSVNGLISSITRFLSYIVLLEAGVGGVVRAALYKPLAEQNVNSISSIIKATEKFFKVIGLIFLLYLFIIALLFPFITYGSFKYWYTFSLVLIIGISTFFQYYFGITYQIFLQADQRQYITDTLNIITVIVNTILAIFLILYGFSIHIVKFASCIIFVVRPIFLNMYVKRKYQILDNARPDNKAIEQRWDGLGHHIAYLLHDNTDITLLTLFTDIKEVSVYAVYHMIVSCIKKVVVTFSTGLEAAFGNMIAKEEKDALIRNFNIFEFTNFSLATILFTSTALLILPFVSLYTSGVTDVNYHRPIFAYILIMAEAIYCFRVPYHSVVLAAGHFKETRNGAFAEAFINVIISVILVYKLGIVGVAIGTLIAITFRTIQYVVYLSRNILGRSIWIFTKKVAIYSLTTVLIIVVVKSLICITIDSYISWILYATIVALIALSLTAIVGLLFYFEEIKGIYLLLKGLMRRKKS